MPVPQQVPGAQQSAEAWVQLQRLARLRASGQHRPLTDDEQKSLDEQQPCLHCQGYHSRYCPRVRTLEWHSNGLLARVEYWPGDQIDWTGVVFSDQGEDEPDGMIAVDRDDLKLALSPYSRLKVLDWPTWRSQREAAERLEDAALQEDGA